MRSRRILPHQGCASICMATTASPSKHDFKLPMPPPQLYTRPGNEIYDGPLTTAHHGFISPDGTPQGSPSKNQLPPGAHDLSNVFEHALRLAPTPGSPSKANLQQSPTSPNKSRIPEFKVPDLKRGGLPGGPTDKQGKENTPPPSKLQYTNQAAASRHEPYKPKETGSAGRAVQRGLPSDVLEKLAKPSVKRLANVTQLCELLSTGHGQSLV